MPWRENSETIYKRLADDYDSSAKDYESDKSHRISDEAKDLYKQDFFDALEVAREDVSQLKVLEVGSGTGVFTELLAGWGFSATGFEPSQKMTETARTQRKETLKNVEIIQGGAEDLDNFEPNTFDLIVSRQVVCHFYDPLKVFNNWRYWLKTGGQIIIIDGLWKRSGWELHSNRFGQGELPDQLPLACSQSWASVAYLLEQAGLEVAKCCWMKKVNEYEERVYANDAEDKVVVRYITAARKTKSR